MAIPKAYQAQMKSDVISGGQNNVTRNMLKATARPLINLAKKRKYFWFALCYMIFFCFVKWSEIVEKWDANAYKIAFPGVSFSVGKKADASMEKPTSEKPTSEKPTSEKPTSEKPTSEKSAPEKLAPEKSAPEKSAAEKPGMEKSSPEKSANDAVKTVDQKDKTNSTVGASGGKPPVDVAANAGAKTQNVVTLETDGAGFDPLSTSSPKEVELLLKLAARRQDIEKKEALLKERELAVSVVEKQQKDKISELTKLKESIEALLKKSDKESQEQHAKLIKYYEGMKPKRAAQIFDRMDIAVLKELVPAMSQKKALTILDQMSVVKVKELLLVIGDNKNLFAKSAANAPKK
jgi:flagellar motility protein MotE (MotC chaperone)